MKIETKYNIGDEVWAIVNDKVAYRYIEAIKITTDKIFATEGGRVVDIKLKHQYCIGYDCWRKEQELFPTKEELLKSL